MANVKKAAVRLPPIISNMYERWTLDCIIDVVQAIAVDFVNRPRQYREVPPGSNTILQDFRFRTGTNPLFPNRKQRSMTFGAILGSSDGMKNSEPTEESYTSETSGKKLDSNESGNFQRIPGIYQETKEMSQFHLDSARLRETARAFVERQVTQGEGQLLQAFLDEAITLQSYLQTLNDDNNVVMIGNTQTGAIFSNAANGLRDGAVASVFGRPPAPQNTWPLRDSVALQDSFDLNGARLIEEVTKAFPTKLQPISQSKFIVIQRIASFGARTITGVLLGDLSADPSELLESRLERFESLIQVTYSWKTALDHLHMLP